MSDQLLGYRGLIAWQKSMDLCEEVYRLTDGIDQSERFGLISQMQRAAVSVPSNIAEGHARGTGKDYAKHLRYARGSLAEIETQIEIAVRTGKLDRDSVRHAWSVCQDTAKLLTRLLQSQTNAKPNA